MSDAAWQRLVGPLRARADAVAIVAQEQVITAAALLERSATFVDPRGCACHM